MNVAAMVEEVAKAVNATVSRSIAPLQRQLDELMAWRQSVGEVKSGAKGERGEPGRDGERGIDGKDAPPVDIEQVVSKVLALVPTPKDGARGADGRDGRDGTDGQKGDPGLNGKDGADGINGKDGVDGKDGAIGQAGKDGDKGERGEPGAAGRDGNDGKDGRDGVDGKDANGIARFDQDVANNSLDIVMDSGDVFTLHLPVPQRGEKGEPGIRGADGLNGANGKDGRDGLNGKDGEDGRDGKDGADGPRGEKGDVASPEDIAAAVTKTVDALLPGMLTKHVELAMNEIAARAAMLVPPGRDGLPGRPGTAGEDGRNGVGIEKMAFESIDGRTHKFIAHLSDGSRQESPVKLAGMVLDAGVFRSGESYERGDFATYGGSGWIAQVDTKSTPGTNSDWRLAVKKGRDGKDGASE